MEDISNLIIQLKKQFNINNIKDYQNLILIIYNSLFIYENQLTPQIKYQLFNLLDYIINIINKNNTDILLNISIEELYTKILSQNMQNLI